jgi:hypothetical protein
MLGFSKVAPQTVVRLAERAAFVLDHGWTFEQYDNAAAGDIAFLREFERLRGEVEKQKLAQAEAKAKSDG